MRNLHWPSLAAVNQTHLESLQLSCSANITIQTESANVFQWQGSDTQVISKKPTGFFWVKRAEKKQQKNLHQT